MYICDCGKTFNTHRALNGHKSVHREGSRYSVSRAKPDAVMHSCMNCEKQFRHSSGTRNKFCSNKCGAEFKTKELVRTWIETGTYSNINVPGWAKQTLREMRGNACEVCGISEWNNQPIVLDCDHADGNPHNNHINNLRLICPNCHSQTTSYKGRNKGNGRKTRYK